jgi:DNA-binding HxlR family transcriptional regulator
MVYNIAIGNWRAAHKQGSSRRCGYGDDWVRRKSLSEEKCPVARSLDIIGDWWTLLIVRDALAGVTRFNDFGRSLGAAKSSLSTRLKTLVDQGVFEIRPASDGSAYQEYALTLKGRALAPVLISLAQWGTAHAFKPGDPISAFVDKKKKRLLKKIELKSSDGRVLRTSDIQWLSGLD